MAARIRNSEWEDDIELMNDLKENVSRNLRQSEIVDLMKVKYPLYSWSLRTLSPLCIYGAQDTFSSRIQFLRIWTSNSNPHIIGRFYFDYFLREEDIILTMISGHWMTKFCFIPS